MRSVLMGPSLKGKMGEGWSAINKQGPHSPGVGEVTHHGSF